MADTGEEKKMRRRALGPQGQAVALALVHDQPEPARPAPVPARPREPKPEPILGVPEIARPILEQWRHEENRLAAHRKIADLVDRCADLEHQLRSVTRTNADHDAAVADAYRRGRRDGERLRGLPSITATFLGKW